MVFSDIHIHALYGVDDGAETREEMLGIVGSAYRDGTRYMCLTPHYHPGYYGRNEERTAKAFEQLSEYSAEHYPDLRLYLGNELHYMDGAVEWLHRGDCRTMNGTRYVLVDFSDHEPLNRIRLGLDRLLNGGYRPILAHAERYASIGGRLDEVRAMMQSGVLIQLDAQSLLGGFGLRIRMQSRKLLEAGLADIVSSDAHDMTSRPPAMSECHDFIEKRYGGAYADALCRSNAIQLLTDAE